MPENTKTPLDPAEAARIEARNALALSCRPLAYKIANDFYFRSSESTRALASLEDFQSAALLALVEAADNFTPEKGWQFSTYASTCIRFQLIRFMNIQGIIRVSEHIDKETRRDIRARMGYIGENDDGSCVDLPERPKAPTLDEMEHEEALRELWNATDKLTPQQRRVLRLRYLCPPGENLTLQQAGKEMRLTRERIRQIEVQAIRELRRLVV